MPRIVIARSRACVSALPGIVVPTRSAGLAADCHRYDIATSRHHHLREPEPNRDLRTPAQESRANGRHDRSSPNYTTRGTFAWYPRPQSRLTRGGCGVGS